MSEKNVQGEQQWTKGTSVPTLTQKRQQQVAQGISAIYNANLGAANLGLASPGSALFSSNVQLGGGTTHTHAAAPYVSARFQAPPLDHQTPSQPPITNVPAPSMVFPPPHSINSVLAPIPYTPVSQPGPGAALISTNLVLGPPASSQQFASDAENQTSTSAQHHGVGHFSIDQYQHLNMQSYERNKSGGSFGTAQILCTPGGASNLTPTSPASASTSLETPTANVAPEGSGITCSGAINNQIADEIVSTIGGNNNANKLASTPIHGRLMGLGVHAADDEKMRRIQQVVESGISENAKQQIGQILDQISTLRPVEKLLLYLRLPGEQPETDPLRQPQNPLGTRSEINHTINWVRTHLEQDPQVSIPKQDVYNDYLLYCDRLDIKPLSTADFGKVMKQVFPGIRPRRLGTRGNSRYCYAAMRKTSKLPAPHLPTLSISTAAGRKNVDGELGPSNAVIDNIDEEEESWSVVKNWAECKLQTKVNDLKDLATQIKTKSSGIGVNLCQSTGAPKSSNIVHKKFGPRDPKEKRIMADNGPLKKRRKRKRKGSSSSESSSQPSFNAVSDTKDLQISCQLSPANSSRSSNQNVQSPAIEEEQKPTNVVNIKQEFIDSPGLSSAMLGDRCDSLLEDKNSTQQHSQLLQQMMPMNLAAESRGGIINQRVNPVLQINAFEQVITPSVNNNAAVKNLTSKIMQLSGENQMQSSSPPQSIKQEIGTDDYNTSNILCKKVRKAQQTKGFWANSPTSSNRTILTNNLPIITTTASTPPPEGPMAITSSRTCALSGSSPAVITNYSMGPPAQIVPSTSPNNQTIQEDGALLPKVLSRNYQQLRAKRTLSSAGSANCDPPDLSAVKDAPDLPENLGLPRERVISICNMDKHELDDYFLPEEDNSEDQETELLQYFQMGDVEEKVIKNSSSDAKRISNPTVSVLVTTSTNVTTTTTATVKTESPTMSVRKSDIGNNVKNDACNGKPVKPLSQLVCLRNHSNLFPSRYRETSASSSTPSKTNNTNTVGTASTSLEQSNTKHQQQQQQIQKQTLHYQSQYAPHVAAMKISQKRRVNCSNYSSSDINAARKHYSFLPISPNINTTCATPGSSTGFFASPGTNRILNKQQSLDCETSCDPMIGATNRRKTFMSVTSASAPPSPSSLKQQEQYLGMSHNFIMDQWSTSNCTYNTHSSVNPNNALLLDQASFDIDSFGETSSAAASGSLVTFGGSHLQQKAYNESPLANKGDNNAISYEGNSYDLTQRSRSVPLSQLQRSHSPSFNRAFHMESANGTAYSACNSLAQTPVPPELLESATMLSENSCSQQSTSLKLEVGNVVGSDSTALLDEVVVNEILSSPDFVTSAAQTGAGSKTNCSSAGSSSGYSSGGNFSSSLSNYSSSGSGVGGGAISCSTVSRSVPSTPLPHQNPNTINNAGINFYRRRFPYNSGSINNANDTLAKYNYGNILSSMSRSACDISKSMPSTPITTTPSNFRYSPIFLDDSITSFGTVANENLLVSDAPLPSESLLSDEDSLVNSRSGISRAVDDVMTPNFTIHSESSGLVGTDEVRSATVGEASVVIGGDGTDLLDSL